jgi:hypothetical protein
MKMAIHTVDLNEDYEILLAFVSSDPNWITMNTKRELDKYLPQMKAEEDQELLAKIKAASQESIDKILAEGTAALAASSAPGPVEPMEPGE